jgi:hypothetical protein
MKKIKMQHLQQVYTVIAVVSAAVGIGEKLYNHYSTVKSKRRRRNFGFNR